MSFQQESRKRALQSPRICPGHERAVSIESTVMDLDVKEEGMIIVSFWLHGCGGERESRVR